MEVGLSQSFNKSLTSGLLCYMPTRVNSLGIFVRETPSQFALPLFGLQTFLIISIDSIVSFLLQPLMQPTIVSQIIGSILIGPSILGKWEFYRMLIFPTRGAEILDMCSRLGVIFFLFLSGVKMDPTLMWRSGRKPALIAIGGVVFPVVTVGLTIHFLKGYLSPQSFEMDVFPVVFLASTALTAFPVLQSILSQLNLLSSRIGRVALSAAMINQLLGMLILTFLKPIKSGNNSVSSALFSAAALLVIVLTMVFLVRPLMYWIIWKTADGKLVKHRYTTMILLGAMVSSCLTDIFAGNWLVGPLLLGLVIPDGPPLGAALVKKAETVTQGFLLCMFVASCVQRMKLTSSESWHSRMVLYVVFLVGCASKVLGTLVACLYTNMPLIDSVAIGLIMTFKGEMEIITYTEWRDFRLLDDQSFTVLILSITVITAILTPLVKSLSEVAKQPLHQHKRTVQHSKLYAEMRVLACLHDKDSMPTILNFIEAFCTSRDSPYCLYVLNLIELLGHATPMLVAHERDNEYSTSGGFDHIATALWKFEQQATGDFVTQLFTCIAPYSTMHEDIAQFAFDKNVTLIIIPYHKQYFNGMEVIDRCFQVVNSKIHSMAPCSTGMIFNQAGYNKYTNHGVQAIQKNHNVAILFFGGPDDREALALGFRFIRHPHLTLTVLRFLPWDPNGDDEMERRLDDEMVDSFLSKIFKNDSVLLKEIIVRDGEETASQIRAIHTEFDLVVVGFQQKTNLKLVEGLGEWSENPELGVMGDVVSSLDVFGGMASILVIKQHR